ncbi:hypothetical protein FA13DRAFT_49236 [Coprinellus micaceus]|uniref:Uncharacterized protein n=1 Tax=Coprinellus micaceus TaxID=71717 RepID=A0A4Y7U1V0_COPMI|nr:hypothetical protein FA13DRAFT_49236 [Coprinellus micaceus]
MNAESLPDMDQRDLGQKFANAKLTSISVGSGKGLVGTVAVDNLRALIGAQPGLEEFISYNHNDCANSFDFATIVGDVPLQEGFQPSLRTLHGANLKIAPSPNVLKCLANLTSLCISNLLPDHDALWPAFHESDITLRTLVIEKPTERLTDYLTGYRGLENLVITRQGSGTRVEVTDNTKHRFLEEGIAHHSNSLSTLQISFDPYLYAHFLLWGLDERQLAWLEGFPKLEVLTVPFVHDAARVPKGTKISMVRRQHQYPVPRLIPPSFDFTRRTLSTGFSPD